MEFPRKLDLTSRLYGAGLHAGRLTNSAPMTPWLKKDAKPGEAPTSHTPAGETEGTPGKGTLTPAMVRIRERQCFIGVSAFCFYSLSLSSPQGMSASTSTLPSLKNARQPSTASLGVPGAALTLSASGV
jgi:hypothetical protein